MNKSTVLLGFFCLSLWGQAESQGQSAESFNQLAPNPVPPEILSPAVGNTLPATSPKTPSLPTAEAVPLSITPTGEEAIYVLEEEDSWDDMPDDEWGEDEDTYLEEDDDGPVPLSIELVEEDVLAEPDEGPYPVLIEPVKNNHVDLPYETFSDVPMIRNISIPDWFKNTFLDLPEDLESAIDDGKQGLIVYFSQRHCAYCEAMQKTVFNRPDLQAYIERYFDVVAIDVWGELEVTTMSGEISNETQFANNEGTYFTPSLLFYNAQGEEALRLRGYYPPYVIRSALDYVISNSYRRESFREYQARGKPPEDLKHSQKLHKNPLFMSPPYLLDRQLFPSKRPLLVLFEQPRCHACNILHTDLLLDPVIQQRFQQFDVVQLNILKDTPILTPNGQKTTAKQWAEQEGIFYTPSLLFFDQHGKEVFRVESVIHHVRLNQVLKYVLQRGYQETPMFERWISRQLSVEEEANNE